MELLTLFLIFGISGILIGMLRSGKKTGSSSTRTPISTKKLASRVEGKWRTLFSPSSQGRDSFQAWATGTGANLFPDEFTVWLVRLPEPEADGFSLRLSDYAQGLGFRLKDLMDGSLDRDPMLRQVFVEAIVVYSQAYRKAKQARQQAEGSRNPASNSGNRSQENKTDHQGSGTGSEASTPVSAA